MSRSRNLIVAGICALLVFGIPFAVISARAQRTAEIRLIATGQQVSVLVSEGSVRILVINSSDRGEARSAVGLLTRPWEPDVTMVIAPANDAAAAGLWEALQPPSIRQVVVAGLPGREPVWTWIENEVRDRGIELHFAGEPVTIHAADFNVEVHPGADVDSAYLLTRRREVVVAVALGSTVPDVAAHALVASREPERGARADVIFLPSAHSDEIRSDTILVDSRRQTRLILEDAVLRVRGGRYLPRQESVN